MIGIIVWLILIFAIVIIINPSFLLVFFTTLFAYGAIYIIYLWLKNRIMNLFGKSEESDTTAVDRERAIKEWEKKWGRPHPSRTINRK